jgi:glutathione S-transferase
MSEYQLYCFAQSGNAYRVALMLNLIGADWEPIWVDFFAKGEQRTPEYRTNINEMGEARRCWCTATRSSASPA